jgi:hypothetical protein
MLRSALWCFRVGFERRETRYRPTAASAVNGQEENCI